MSAAVDGVSSNLVLPANYNGRPAKFVQLTIRGENYVGFADGAETHGEIARRSLDSLRVVYRWERPTGAPVPAVRGNDYAIIGAGLAVIDRDRRTLKATDSKSGDYLLKINREHLESVALDNGWSLDIAADEHPSFEE